MRVPDKFWMIGFHNLVWSRELLAFVPCSVFSKLNQEEIMGRFWFLDLDEAKAQMDELAAMGVEAKVCTYNLKAKVG